ncbi:MAG: hypothetical protein LKJ47_07480 [Bifidobacteriaceae bacterium]|nr:hypothetical protein [Bifidobacteriaceae bacterium]
MLVIAVFGVPIIAVIVLFLRSVLNVSTHDRWRILISRRKEKSSGETTRAKERSAIDEGQFTATLISQLESGSDIRSLCEKSAGRTFALSTLNRQYVGEALDAMCGAARTARRAQTCARIVMCIRLSDSLGSQLVESLQVVKELYEQERHMEELRAKAFSLPRATGKLLALLPIITLLGGEIVGAHPLLFLTGSVMGWVCCIIGLLFFGAGAIWMRRLLMSFGTLSCV